MNENDISDEPIGKNNGPAHKITDLYYSLNFDLIKVSDSKASTVVVISGQSILITAFLLANIIKVEGVLCIAIGFCLSVVFNAIAVYLALSALRPRTFQESETAVQPLYSYIVKHTRKEFIDEFLKLQTLPKTENDRHYAELIYHISDILQKKMKLVRNATRFFFIGIGILVASIFILVFDVFLI